MQNSKITEIQVDGGCSFNKALIKSFGNLLVFIFYSKSNQQSKQFLQKINNSISVFGQYDNVQYYSLSAEKCPQTFKKYQVQKIPSVVFTQTDRKIIQRYQGNDIGTIFDMTDRLAQEHKTKFQKDMAVWFPKIKNLIQSCPFIVFTKGTPENPKCGFTKTLLQILKEHKIQYTYYDIISDGEMGSWTRHYSKWPTFPQIFINGKLIGGLDVTKQLIEKGQFQKMIPNSCRQSPPEQRYKKFIQQHQTVVFIDGFTFQNKSSKAAIEQAYKRYGDNVAIYNIAIQTNMKSYIIENISREVPFTIHKKQINKN